MRSVFTKTIWIVSFVSLFTDIASEMLYPVMPVYLRSIGFSVLLIGILEGIAEATAGLSKGYFGNLSDAINKRVPFIRAGYSFSAISKPMMVLFINPVWIFFARTLDRFGKGLRTSARDALLSEETTPGNKGKVFGFHRSMDTIGAAIGPGLALLFLLVYPGHYKPLFYFAFFPGIIAISLTFLLREKRKPVSEVTAGKTAKEKISFFSYLTYWKNAVPGYRLLVAGLLMFTFFNSSDAFLLLALKSKGFSDTGIIGFYIFFNLVYAFLALPLGVLADKAGLFKTLLAGLLIFSCVYFLFGFADSVPAFGLLFLFYGIYYAATEGISKALISNMVNKAEVATAIGFYNSFASVFTLFASSMAGVLWYTIGPRAMFMISGAGVLCVVVFLAIMFGRNTRRVDSP